MMLCVQLVLLLLSTRIVNGDTNVLTGANDVIVVRNSDGDLYSTPFSVQFGKAAIWLPRSGHVVSIKINGIMVPLSLTLNSEGHAYFSTTETEQKNYRFWSAFFGTADPKPYQMTDTATSAQLEQLNLKKGQNSIDYQVRTSSGSLVSTSAIIFLLDSTQKFVVSDIDGTITRSDFRGFILPALGLSDWKHDGVVKLFRSISEQGYMMIYLSSRSIGQADSTRSYIYSLREERSSMPAGPVLLSTNSVLSALKTEVVDGNPEVQKIAKLARVRGIFNNVRGEGKNPLYAAYGNRETDFMAYRALNIDPARIFRLNEDSLIYSGAEPDLATNFTMHLDQVQTLYPTY